MKGSMDLAKQVDPEEWHKIMDRFFAILSEGVHRFEGTINQYAREGIMGAIWRANRARRPLASRLLRGASSQHRAQALRPAITCRST